MKPLYTEVFTLKISKSQKSTLEILKSRNIKVSSFVRKAIHEKDSFALVICEIVDYKFDKIEFKKFTNNLSEQLMLDFGNEM